ncbi:MAG: sugar phosphate isomerase/epimerase family protein [Opitutaceae bacterium]|nr:sugar phosphate isomerase/epimerase family protein [Opitutaceae bacterium]
MPTLPRRDFLKFTAAASLAATLPFRSTAAAPAGANPFNRQGKPLLRLSLAAYSFRENFPIMRGKPNDKVPAGRATDMFKFIDYCAAHGCEGAELTSYFFAEESDDYLLRLRRHAFLRGVAVSGTAIGNNFSHPKGSPKIIEEIATTKKWIDRAALLGAPHIRVFAGVEPKGFARAEADKVVIASLEECCDYAGKKGIFLGLENHDSIGSAAALLPMVKAVKSPWIGINLDSGNFRTPDPYKDFAACVPYSVNVQFKVEIDGDQPRTKKPADLKRFTRLLRDGGYQGWVALEYEAKEDSAVAVPHFLNEMRSLFA